MSLMCRIVGHRKGMLIDIDDIGRTDIREVFCYRCDWRYEYARIPYETPPS